jgi:predicted dehydrogenase
MSEKLKIGILGCGNMAQMAHLPAFKSLANADVVALCDFRLNVAQVLCARWDIPNSCANLEKMLALDIDAVAVLTPAHSHLRDIRLSLEAGKHVFTEKPAAMCVESVRELQQVAQSAEKTVMVGYMKRHEQNIRELLKRQSAGDWGNLLFVRTHSFIGSQWDAAVGSLVRPVTSGEVPPFNASVLDPGPAWLDAPRDQRFYSFDNPYFGLLDTGSHSVNLLRYLTGTTPSVNGVRNNGAVRLVDFDFDGVPGVMEFCVNFAMERWDEVTELYFEKASVTIKTPPPLDRQTSAQVEIYTEASGRHENLVLENNRRWAFQLQAEAFVQRVLSGEPGTDLKEAELDVALIEHIYRQETGVEIAATS